MTLLSVNINKIALLRNQRDKTYPNLCDAIDSIIAAGAHGITVHPRPDERHITQQDVMVISHHLQQYYPDIDLNIEGFPDERLYSIIAAAKPQQITLVPDDAQQATSDHGWGSYDGTTIQTYINNARHASPHSQKIALFLDYDDADKAAQYYAMGATHIELYTGPYAHYIEGHKADIAPNDAMLHAYKMAALHIAKAGLHINAGHDLTRGNVGPLLTICRHNNCSINEVSIGHALICDALFMGLPEAVQQFLAAIKAA